MKNPTPPLGIPIPEIWKIIENSYPTLRQRVLEERKVAGTQSSEDCALSSGASMVPQRVAEVSMGPQRVSMDPQLVPGDSLLFTMGPAWVPLLVSIRAQGSFSVHLTCPLEPLVQGALDIDPIVSLHRPLIDFISTLYHRLYATRSRLYSTRSP